MSSVDNFKMSLVILKESGTSVAVSEGESGKPALQVNVCRFLGHPTNLLRNSQNRFEETAE